MKNVSGNTKEETRMIKAVQSAVGAVADGSVGAQTMSDIAVKLGAKCFPLALTVYDHPLIIADDLTPAAVKAPLKSYANAISGSFSYNAAPCSILVSQGKVIRNDGCHAWLYKPEIVLYRTKSGNLGIREALYASQLPDCFWAIGGFGLLKHYDPAAQGFTGQYADVLRKTAHTFVGVKNGKLYLGYVSNMTAQEVNAHVAKLGLEMAIMLDGGHVAAINSANTQINTATTQYYIVQAL